MKDQSFSLKRRYIDLNAEPIFGYFFQILTSDLADAIDTGKLSIIF